MRSEYIHEVSELRIELDSEMDEGYSILPGIDIRYPEKSMPIKKLKIRLTEHGAVLILEHDKHNIVVIPLTTL